MIQRLLKRLHRIFNKDPRSVPAITIAKSGGATITIANLTMTLGGTTSIALTGTLQELVTAINAVSGYTCTVSIGIGDMLSRGLIETTQNIATDPVFGYPTSLLWHEMQVSAWAIDYPPGRTASAAAQMDMATADGEWLDLWCQQYFGVPRINGESDDTYLSRTVAGILAPTQNNRAIENIVAAVHGKSITLDNAVEHAVAYTGRDDELPGRFHAIFPDGTTDGEKDAIRETVQEHKAAGTDFVYSATRIPQDNQEYMGVADGSFSINHTAMFEDTFMPGIIKLGQGWRVGTGLKIGANKGVKEQLFIKAVDANGHTIQKIVVGG